MTTIFGEQKDSKMIKSIKNATDVLYEIMQNQNDYDGKYKIARVALRKQINSCIHRNDLDFDSLAHTVNTVISKMAQNWQSNVKAEGAIVEIKDYVEDCKFEFIDEKEMAIWILNCISHNRNKIPCTKNKKVILHRWVYVTKGKDMPGEWADCGVRPIKRKYYEKLTQDEIENAIDDDIGLYNDETVWIVSHTETGGVYFK